LTATNELFTLYFIGGKFQMRFIVNKNNKLVIKIKYRYSFHKKDLKMVLREIFLKIIKNNKKAN